MHDKSSEAPAATPETSNVSEGSFASGLVPLLLLVVAYILNFIDRQILGVLAVPIKADLHLSDSELGLIAGPAFAIFYSVLALPIARFADRSNRARIVVISCAIWSAFTALGGLALNFTHLFLSRFGLGLGEAGFTAPCYSLIPDLFPPRLRARAFAIFQFGIPIGSALGIFFGGWLAAHLGWRQAFIRIGLIGLPISAILWFCVREPARGRFDAAARSSQARLPFRMVARRLAVTPSYWLISLGASVSSIQMFGLMFWLPSLFKRSFGLSLEEISLFFGSIVLIGGIVGLWLGAQIADRMGPERPRAYALIPAVALLIAGPLYAVAVTSTNLVIAFILFLVTQALGLFGAAPIVASLQQVVHPAIRASSSAIYLLTTGIIGMAFGIWVLGFMSDLMHAHYGDQALKYSILYGQGFYLLASLLLFWASRHIERDWRKAHEPLV